MEQEDAQPDADGAVRDGSAPRPRSPRSRRPRSASAAAAPTTAAGPWTRTARPVATRSAATASQRAPRSAPVPPETRTTAADALIELPEPELQESPEGDEEPSEPTSIVDEGDAQAELSRLVVDAGEPHADTTDVPYVEDLPEPAIDAEPVESSRVEDATILEEPAPADETVAAESAPAPVVDLPASTEAPAHELATEPSVAADRAASDAFRDIVGTSRPDSVAEDRLALELRGLRKRYGSVTAVDGIDLHVPIGSFYGIVGPNGAGKTTTLSMLTGLLRPDEGTIAVYGHDLATDAAAAKRALGVLPDRLRLFDRLTGAQLLAYTGSLRGMESDVIVRRTRDLAAAFGLSGSLGRPVADYSLGMTKKIAIAAALLHAPRMLVLDEPFESVDPVSAAAVLAVLRRFTASGGTVILSSHSMELIESACDRLAIIVDGRILAEGPTADVLAGVTLEDRFVELAGGRSAVEGMEWLHSYSADE